MNYKHNILVTGLILIYPVSQMSSAGWIATTVNYLWPAAMGAFALVYWMRLYQQKKVHTGMIVLYLLAEAYATNFETFSVMFLCITVSVFITMMLKRKIRREQIIPIIGSFAISIGNIALALFSPGNATRAVSEVHWMKDFDTLTFVDKTVLGISDTMVKLIDFNLIFAIFCVLLVLVTLVKSNFSTWAVSLSAFPLLIVFYRLLPSSFTDPYFLKLNMALDQLEKGTRVDPSNYYGISIYVPLSLFFLIIFVIGYVLLNYGDTLEQSLLMCVIVGSGLATRFVMGFTPTIYASSNRTFVFLDIAMIFVCCELFELFDKSFLATHYATRKCMHIAFILLVALAVVSNSVAIGYPAIF
ncbi:DUF6056 family protein [Lacticaseibacillus daqingensis]|uniref:DUF6056 family protein n=1 Tax=Lacticaseibacillus daqingensis TaxID=2486014 RepID=UPI000F794A00|nr:DUF6056 family protein [Lacticaseibacillus daqingensis]